VRIPPWLTILIAVVVLAFGVFRISLALRKPVPGEDGVAPRGGLFGSGLYRMSPRIHLLVGVVYLLLGGALFAASFGFNPFG
jgi:hypothetical protein